jgi:hypothetical protein
MRHPFHQPVVLERTHEPAHRRRAHLLSARKRSERRRPAEHQDGERREPRGSETAFLVDTAYATEQVDGSRVQSVGDVEGVGH